jgi:TetR/AcrR family transcriptional regulator
MKTKKSERSEESVEARTRILDAAVNHFSENGLAGARMEQIAEAAGVNKALLYYYFRSKDELYAAALESVADGVRASSLAVLETKASAGERFLRSVLNHFDRIYANPGFQSLMQQEMVRLHCGEENALSPLVEKVFRPLMRRMQRVLEEGISARELIETDPAQIRYAALGANVLYFLSAPLMQLIEGGEPLGRRALAARRSSAIRYLGLTIFTDRRRGERVADRVLDSSPMPEYSAMQSKPTVEFRAKRRKK